MCGRFTLKTPASDLIAAFDLRSSDRQLGLFEPRWNIAPTQQVPVVRLADGSREAVAIRWGLIPSWSKEPGKGAPLINARSETVAEKPSFRTALKRRRCLMPADGFYEWQAAGLHGAGKGAKQPFYIHRKDDAPFAFAALWECWHNKDDPAAAPIESCTLVNTEAVGWMTEIHHRMPVILEPKDFDLWLDPELQEAGPLAPLFEPAEHDELVAEAVSTYVNKATNEGPKCVAVQRTLF